MRQVKYVEFTKHILAGSTKILHDKKLTIKEKGVYMEKEKFLAAVYMIIKNEDGEILLQRRQGTKLWPGFLALPAGHIDEGENAIDAVIREAREELSIIISEDDIVDSFVVNRRNKSLKPYFDIYFEIGSYKGELIGVIIAFSQNTNLPWATFRKYYR